ncbi:MAG: hypothetical protein ACRD4Q_13865, partial [Candidatus Acidiferrales bacterium]
MSKRMAGTGRRGRVGGGGRLGGRRGGRLAQPRGGQPALFQRIQAIVDGARAQAARSVDTAQVISHWLVG